MDVASVMTPEDELVTGTIPGSREDVLELLQNREFSSVPIVKKAASGDVFRGLVSREGLIEQPDEEQLALLIEEVETIGPGASVQSLAELMRRTGQRRVPVVADGLAGIVTITDVVEAIADGVIAAETEISSLAEEDVLAVYSKTPLTTARQILFYAGEAYAIVLDAGGEMIGIVTEVDILDVAEIVEGTEGTGDSIAEEDSTWAWEGIKAVGNRMMPTRNVEFPGDLIVEDVMSSPVVSVAGSQTVTETAQQLIEQDIEQIPLARGGQVVAIVKDMSLLAAVHD